MLRVEHDDAGDEDRGQRQGDRQETEPGQLQPDARQPPEGERRHDPDDEGPERDEEREKDHGENL